jgi:hypothetical protein
MATESPAMVRVRILTAGAPTSGGAEHCPNAALARPEPVMHRPSGCCPCVSCFTAHFGSSSSRRSPVILDARMKCGVSTASGLAQELARHGLPVCGLTALGDDGEGVIWTAARLAAGAVGCSRCPMESHADRKVSRASWLLATSGLTSSLPPWRTQLRRTAQAHQ